MRTLSLLILLSLTACRSGAVAGTPAPLVDAGPVFKSIAVARVDGSRLLVKAELATDEPTREQGLMNRRSMGGDDGMLFAFQDEREETFWMKNTLIPLDMIFIRTDGTIVGIVPEATPETETPRTVGIPSRYVLEMNGGWCASKGVKAGDKVLLGDALTGAVIQ